jgi:hypothetical protein
MPDGLPDLSTTLIFEIACQKLGQPVPESYFVFESKSTVSQQMQW